MRAVPISISMSASMWLVMKPQSSSGVTRPFIAAEMTCPVSTSKVQTKSLKLFGIGF